MEINETGQHAPIHCLYISFCSKNNFVICRTVLSKYENTQLTRTSLRISYTTTRVLSAKFKKQHKTSQIVKTQLKSMTVERNGLGIFDNTPYSLHVLRMTE